MMLMIMVMMLWNRYVPFAINRQQEIKQSHDGHGDDDDVHGDNDDGHNGGDGHGDDDDDDGHGDATVEQVCAVCHQPAAGDQAEPPPPAVHRGDQGAGAGVEQHAFGQKTGDPFFHLANTLQYTGDPSLHLANTV